MNQIPVSPTSFGRLGTRLKHRRLLLGLTMKELARQGGCSESLISKIENGKAAPSLVMLHNLAVALDTNVGALLDSDEKPIDIVNRASTRSVVTLGQSADRTDSIQIERLIPHADGRLLQADIYIVKPGCGSESAMRHVGEEMGYVLNGTLELHVDNEKHLLRKGDSFIFRSERSHGYFNSGKKTAYVLWVNTPATF